ncbi:MAG: ABC transporter substrate-binding protein [Clostridia bacterium]|nr:ABC transporter substrate-binding protein [Clostridia bacterium]
MKAKKITALILALCMVFMFAACSGSGSGSDSTDAQGEGSAEGLEDFNIVLDWYPNAVHSFIYVAIEKGYYEEEGLRVNVQFPANTNDAITMTAAGKADAGLYYQPNIIQTAVNQKIPIKILGTVVQHPLNVVISMKDSGINSANDLRGKKLGYPGTTDNEYYVAAMAKHNGFSPDEIEMLDVGFDINSSLITGNVDAIIGAYINHEYPELLNEGFDVTYFDISEEGVPDYEELVLITGEAQVQSESDKLARFMRASKRGFEDMKNDPEEALSILLANQDKANYPLNPEVETMSMEILLPLMSSDEHGFLEINEESWQNLAVWEKDIGIISEDVDMDTLVAKIDG